MHQIFQSFATFIDGGENRAALVAVRELGEDVIAGRPVDGMPLLLHGPTGCGKTHLVSALAEHVARGRPEAVVTQLGAGDFTLAGMLGEQTTNRTIALARASDLLIVEDLQRLHASAIEPFTQTVDELLAQGQPMVFTANAGPQELRQQDSRFTARLVSRLAGGTVIGVGPLDEAGRLAWLGRHCQGLPLTDETLRWLAGRLSGGVRQLAGAVQQMEQLARDDQVLDRHTLTQHLQVPGDDVRLSLDVIARQVSRFFQVNRADLCSATREHQVLLPRQVGMYLARRLTPLSLQEIGEYFGGRDHSTVLHACRKVEAALDRDVTLSGAIRQLSAELV